MSQKNADFSVQNIKNLFADCRVILHRVNIEDVYI